MKAVLLWIGSEVTKNQKTVLKKAARGVWEMGREVMQFYNSTPHKCNMSAKN
jgi:hypothetical protein